MNVPEVDPLQRAKFTKRGILECFLLTEMYCFSQLNALTVMKVTVF